jgi:O-antigen ligase
LRTAGLPGYALIALLLGAMLQITDTSGAGAAHSSEGSILFIRGPLTLLALLFLLFEPRVARMRLSDSRAAFFGFGLLFFVSVLWSWQRVQTLGKAMEILLGCIVFLEVSRRRDALRRVDALRQLALLTTAAVSVFTVCGFVLRLSAFVQNRPGLFTSTTAQSPFLSGNGLGYVASGLFLVVFAEWQANRIRTASAVRQMCFALALFSVSASRTSFIILGVSVFLVVFRKSKVTAVLGAVTIVSAILALRQVLLMWLQGHEAATDFETLSGRTVLWQAGYNQFLSHPWLGAGGGVGGKATIARIADIYLQTVSSLHNGFMEVLTGLGIFGFLLGVYMMVVTTARVLKLWPRHPEYSGTYVLIVHVWLTTIMSTGVLGWMGYEMAFFLCIATNVDLVRRQDVVVRARARYALRREAAYSLAGD